MDFFPAGVVVSADDLVGRETTIIRWMTWLMGGQSIFVAGPRRRGKSSVAQEVVRRLGHRGRMALSLDCSAYESEDAFARGLVDVLFPEETGFSGVLQRFGRMLRGLEPSLTVSDHVTRSPCAWLGRPPVN